MFVVLALWPTLTDVMAALWFERLRRGSWVSEGVKDISRGMDQTCMFESSDPVMRCECVTATQETAWRCAAGVETCLPVHT